MTKTVKTQETAAQAHSRNVDEALRRIEVLKDALEAEQARHGMYNMVFDEVLQKHVSVAVHGIKPIHWGDVGSMAEAVTALGQAGHYLGIEEFTEK